MDASAEAAARALAFDAEQAGMAMGCRYFSSTEYETALIAERRRAGLYRKPCRFAAALWGALAVVLLLSIVATL